MIEFLQNALMNPASHALTLVIGAGLYHVFVATPIRRQNDELRTQINEFLEIQQDALRRITGKPTPP